MKSRFLTICHFYLRVMPAIRYLTLTIILLVFFGVGQCAPVTPSPGGNLFYCSVPGCAADVTHAYCNDQLVFSHSGMKNCTGPPPANTVCQQDGRAFVSFDAPGSCEFEGKEGYIMTEECTDRRNICALNIAITAAPKGTEKERATLYDVTGVICGLLLVVGLIVGISLYICKTRKQSQHPLSYPDETVPMRDRPRESSGRL